MADEQDFRDTTLSKFVYQDMQKFAGVKYKDAALVVLSDYSKREFLSYEDDSSRSRYYYKADADRLPGYLDSYKFRPDLADAMRDLYKLVHDGVRKRRKGLQSAAGVTDACWLHYGKEVPPQMAGKLRAWGVEPTAYVNVIGSLASTEALDKAPALRARLAFTAFAISGLMGDPVLGATTVEGALKREMNIGFDTALPTEVETDARGGKVEMFLVPRTFDPQTGGEYTDGPGMQVDPEETYIGRYPQGKHVIVVSGDAVSRTHCRMWRDENTDTWMVSDCGSRNGTLIVSAETGQTTVVAPPRAKRGRDWQPTAYPIHYDDKLVLGVGGTTSLIAMGKKSLFS